MRIWKSEIFEGFDNLDAVCKMIGNNTNHKFCLGIEVNCYMTECC